MNQRLLLFTLLGTATACQRETDILPTAQTLAGEVVGTYRTNVYLDPSCVALAADKLPYTELRAESDSTVTLTYVNLYPVRSSERVPNVTLRRHADAIHLRVADTSIGTLQTDRVFMDTGMEKQGNLLRVSFRIDPQRPVYFAGSK